MNIILKRLSNFSLFLPAIFLAGCAGTSPEAAAPSAPEASAGQHASEATGEQIRVGMTKAQVLRAWGEPSGRDVSAQQEVWVYGNQHMKRMIPYAGPFLNVNTRKVLFRNGRVADFRSTDSGSVWSQAEGMGGSRFSGW